MRSLSQPFLSIFFYFFILLPESISIFISFAFIFIPPSLTFYCRFALSINRRHQFIKYLA